MYTYARMTQATKRNGTPPVIISGAGNFRSLGGLPTHDGRRIREHFLMRSDRLSHLTREGWEQLAATGLTTVCDLRSREECAQHPNSVPALLGIDEVACEIHNDLRGDRSLLDLLIAQPTAAGAETMMVEVYRRLPQQVAPVLGRIGERLLNGGAPLLIHCTAGKDRTGVVVALLLQALGVSPEEIERDYLASSTWLHKGIHRESLARGLAATLPADAIEAVVDPLLDVRAVYLRTAFETIAKDFGSPEKYLEIAAGFDPTKRERLRDLALI
jgi:protein-tyrosine phosphatase